jgi:prevent-host-death family protein
MRSVTLTELRRNLDGFVKEAQGGDIVITKYGKEVGRLIGATASTGASANLSGRTPPGDEVDSESDSDGATELDAAY